MPRPGRFAAALVVTLALTGCKSAAEREAERKMAAIEAFSATVPSGDPKAFARETIGYLDKLKALEDKLPELRAPVPMGGDPPNPPARPVATAAAVKLAPAVAWIEAARAEHDALEAAFRSELQSLEQDAHADLTKALNGGTMKSARELGEAISESKIKPIVLWHGTGSTRGFDEDHQNLPYPERRAVDAGARFIVGFVQRVDGEGVTFVNEKVTAERKEAIVAVYAMPNKRRLGVFKVEGEAARLPTPVPLAGTVLPGPKPPVIESLLKAP